MRDYFEQLRLRRKKKAAWLGGVIAPIGLVVMIAAAPLYGTALFVLGSACLLTAIIL